MCDWLSFLSLRAPQGAWQSVSLLKGRRILSRFAFRMTSRLVIATTVKCAINCCPVIAKEQSNCGGLACRLGRRFCFAEVSTGHPHRNDGVLCYSGNEKIRLFIKPRPPSEGFTLRTAVFVYKGAVSVICRQ